MGQRPRAAAHEGHEAGEASLLDVVAGAIEVGVTHLSAYAFSTENWRRSPDEVRFLMGFNRDVHPPAPRPAQRVGRPDALGRAPAAAVAVGHRRARGRRGADRGQHRPDPHFCVNYGGRAEIADAVLRIADDVAAGG